MPATQDNAAFTLVKEIDVAAPIETTFASLLEQLGPRNETHEGTPMPMVLEPRVGGRWYRDLGGDAGHLWALVQSYRPPTLLEFHGPLFMSNGSVNTVQYRLAETGGGTHITLTHAVNGEVADEMRDGMNAGWQHMLDTAKSLAERG